MMNLKLVHFIKVSKHILHRYTMGLL